MQVQNKHTSIGTYNDDGKSLEPLHSNLSEAKSKVKIRFVEKILAAKLIPITA